MAGRAMTTLAWTASAYVALVVTKAALAAVVARREPRLPPHPGRDVTVLQAILSGDPRLPDVLADNLRVLPQARFLWLVDADDPVAQQICRALAVTHAPVRVDVLEVAAPPPHLNPKLWKLEAARAACDSDVLLVLDDDTRMPAATLAALTAALDQHALATSLPSYVATGGWPTRLLSQFVANNAATTYLPLVPWLAPITINGMAYALRRDTLEAMGGFAPLLTHLTDDLAVAGRVRRRGGRIFQSSQPHLVETTVRDATHYRQLMHRWFVFALVLQRSQPMALQALIGVLHGLPPLLFVTIVVLALSTPSAVSLALLATVIVVRAGVLTLLHRAIGVAGSHRVVASIVSELLQPLHLLHGLVSRRIVWRTRRYHVRSDSDFEAV